MRNVMVVAQVALALVLLIGSGLMLTSFSRLRAFYSGVLERLQANPVTANSAMLFPFPFGGGNAQASLSVIGQPERPPKRQVSAELNSISPGYLRASGVRLVRGRDF